MCAAGTSVKKCTLYLIVHYFIVLLPHFSLACRNSDQHEVQGGGWLVSFFFGLIYREILNTTWFCPMLQPAWCFRSEFRKTLPDASLLETDTHFLLWCQWSTGKMKIGILGNSGQVLGNFGQNQWKQAANSLGIVNKIQDREAPPVVSRTSKEYAHWISGISLMLGKCMDTKLHS